MAREAVEVEMVQMAVTAAVVVVAVKEAEMAREVEVMEMVYTAVRAAAEEMV